MAATLAMRLLVHQHAFLLTVMRFGTLIGTACRTSPCVKSASSLWSQVHGDTLLPFMAHTGAEGYQR